MSSNLVIRSGNEGPHYDPYSFTEFVRGDITYHQSSLCDYLKVDDKKIYEPNADIVEFFMGTSPKILRKIQNRIENPTKCNKCHSKHLEYHDGFYGESFLICSKCGTTVAYHFDVSKVM